MPEVTTDDGVALHVQETGSGSAVVFVHEFAGDARSWEAQLRHFGQRHRAVAFNARGYPPSAVPPDAVAYGQDRAADDIAAVLDGLGIDAAHVVGLSMGGFATLHFGFRHPERARSLVVAGCGYGAEPDKREAFRAEGLRTVELIRTQGMRAYAERAGQGPSRVQLQNKDPRGFAEFAERLAEHDATGSANTQLAVQRERPSLWDLTDRMRALDVPVLILTGDEDWPCLRPALLMKEHIPGAAIAVMPNSGHAINLEDPDEFNRLVGRFHGQVDSGRWPRRDPRAAPTSITGLR